MVAPLSTLPGFTRHLSRENLPEIADRVEALLAHSEKRSIVLIERYLDGDFSPLRVTPNLFLDPEEASPFRRTFPQETESTQPHAFTAYFNRLKQFHLSTVHATLAEARRAWENPKPGVEAAVITVDGWGHEPRTDDHIILQKRNTYGVLTAVELHFAWHEPW